MAKKKPNNQLKDELKRLKKTGLIKLDLRKITDKSLEDSKIRNGLVRLTRKYQDVIEGKTAVAKVKDKTSRDALASRGHKVTRDGFVFITKKTGEDVKVSRKGNITFSRQVKDRKSGKMKTEVIIEPNLNFKNVQSIEDAINLYASSYSNSNHQIAFTYYGNISKRTFGSVKEAMLEIISYVQKQNEIGTTLNPADIPEIMKSVQLVTYIDSQNYGRARAELLDNKAKFTSYFKKLSKKR